MRRLPDLSAARMSASSCSSSVPVEEPRNAFTPADARQALEFGQRADIAGRGADIEGVVAMHAVRRAGQLVFDAPARVVVGGSVFGISKTPVTPPSTAARLPLSRSSLCSLPGSRKWHLGVDHAGQDMQAPGLEGLGRLGARKRPDGGDAPANDPDIAGGNAGGGGDDSAADQEVEARELSGSWWPVLGAPAVRDNCQPCGTAIDGRWGVGRQPERQETPCEPFSTTAPSSPFPGPMRAPCCRASSPTISSG